MRDGLVLDIVDIHAHIVPDRFPDCPDPGESRWPCMQHGAGNAASVMIGERSFREVDHRSWDAGRRIEDMDAMGVVRQALSPMPELLSYWFAPTTGLEMCRWVNDAIAQMVSVHPARFSGLASVPLQDPESAARELGRIRADGFAGIEIGSNINGHVLGDERFSGVYAEAERLDLAIFVHALHPIGADRLGKQPDLIPFAAFPLDTALAAVSLIRAGVPERFPALRFGFSHGGGAIVPLAHRLGQGYRLTDGFRGTLTKTPAEYAAAFYYDSLVYDAGYLAYLANEFAPGQVFCGTDYPYAIMEARPRSFLGRSALDVPESVRFEAANRFLGHNRI